VVYHFERPHYRLRQSLGIPSGLHARQRFFPRTSAQAAGPTTRRWTILETRSVAYPAPPLISG
jgi:hypothetical protein